ncbi:hypothetical protein [Cognatilysobacter segetis]|uniref:hypothetical protein n=1 Tax=Cognatilysobacter segetis TaxID=2492394 RepID=UPI00105FBC2D|nr:hypothetical protein [Lysobacter segetis]
MIRARAAALAAALLIAAPLAQADQFEYLDLPQAQAALRRLHVGDVVHLYCAPCGDARSQRMTIRTLGIDRVWDRRGGARVYRDSDGAGFWIVETNDIAIDLAYVYVRDGGRWRNLATLLGLEPVEVPAELPTAATGSRWRCGARYDNPYWTVFGRRRDPCPVDVDAYEAAGRAEPGWR